MFGFELKSAFCLVCVVCLSTFSWSATNSCKFKRGDSDGNGTVNIADAQHLFAYAYSGGPAPPNKDAADANDDGAINGTDSNYLTLYLYVGGSAPPNPGPTTADCDPTTSDALEPSCTPVGTLTVTSASVVPSTIAGPAWDCNQSFVHLGKREIDIHSENSETTEGSCQGVIDIDQLTNTLCCNKGHTACNHSDTRTRWTFTWNIGSSPSVERLAFNSSCTELYLQIDWAASFFIPAGTCACFPVNTGADLLSWKPEDAQIKLTFKNQTTLQLSEQSIFWFHDFMTISATSLSSGGFPCSEIAKVPGPGPNPNAEDKTLSDVSWAGNDQWKLEKIEVNFIATFYRNYTLDNCDRETVSKGEEWSVYLRTLAYDNL